MAGVLALASGRTGGAFPELMLAVVLVIVGLATVDDVIPASTSSLSVFSTMRVLVAVAMAPSCYLKDDRVQVFVNGISRAAPVLSS